MPRTLILAALITLFSGCLSSKMNKFLGQDKDEIVGTFGPPEQVLSDGHTGHIYLYSQRLYYSNPWATDDRTRYTMFFIDRHDLVYRWVVRNNPNPPGEVIVRDYRY